MKRLLTFLLALATLASCMDREPFLYRVVTFGFTRSDGSLIADDGIRYIFPSTVKGDDWGDGRRVVAVIDVSEAVSENTYKARLQQYTTPLFKDPVVLTDPEVPDTLGTEDIAVGDVWYAGGCLNMMNVIKLVEGEGNGNHVINLMADMRNPVEDTIKFEVHHRSELDSSPTDFTYDYSFYSSFPVSSLMPGRDSVVVKVSWTWDGAPASVSGKVKI